MIRLLTQNADRPTAFGRQTKTVQYLVYVYGYCRRLVAQRSKLGFHAHASRIGVGERLDSETHCKTHNFHFEHVIHNPEFGGPHAIARNPLSMLLELVSLLVSDLDGK